MRPYLLLFLVFFACIVSVRAQTIEPGYLVLSSGDTLRGEVENDFWEDPPTAVRFRPTPTTALTTYSTLQLRGLGLGSGRRLRLELLPLDRSATTTVGHLPSSARSFQKPEQVLADVLVEGPASLLGVTLQGVHHFFVRREAQPYFEMTERNYLKLQNGVQVVADANNYQGQLLLYFGDCPAATAATARAPFTAAGLTTVVQAYNRECSATRQAGQELAADKVPANRTIIRAGLLAGVRYNSFQFDGAPGAATDVAGLNADGRVHAQFGAYADVVGGGRRLALHTALLASRFGHAQPVSLRYSKGTGSFIYRGTLLNLQVGLRRFVALSPTTQFIYGGGYEINGYLRPESEITYGASKDDFLVGFRGTALPYLEVGLVHHRFGLQVHSRLYQDQYYADYRVSVWALGAVLSYRLSADTDQPAAGK
ncbi:hypothetical protein [Hymenobacter chitinivorans]|uniref:Outer membrane protein with beta-barrel domain n=1 Tax=Hymenobacter chitinivorans DSM 11115 TaxID=1121954 RepID=A0A2M9B4K4_9BACT|nr:hypothetical protein [Hymenobacter chitinivorans]PJJ52867.1 hypothetical protein CLV45_3524 [Hymenobacter chitinivorans DSM 11115]